MYQAARAAVDNRREVMFRETIQIKTRQAIGSVQAKPTNIVATRSLPKGPGRPTGITKAGAVAGQRPLQWAQAHVNEGEAMEE